MQINTHAGVARIFEMPSVYGLIKNPRPINDIHDAENMAHIHCVFSLATSHA